MKKLLGYVMVAGALLMAGGCQKEGSEVEVPASVKTTFSVQIPMEPQTKDVSKAEKTDIVYYEVWDEAFQQRLFPYEASQENFARVNGCAAEVIIDLVQDQKFNLVFWTQNEACGAYSWNDLRKVNVDYSKFTADQKDVYDAFYSVEKVVVDGSPKSVYLYRPFAQVNFGASQMNSSLGKILLQGNTVEISEVAGTFNTVAGVGENPVKNVVFSTKADFVEDKTIEVDNSTLSWVAMNYLLVSSTNVEVTANFSTNFGNVRHVVENVPVQRNFRTNIVGDLFTTGASLRIIVKPDFVKPEIPPIEIN
jgi:hypothetical protein